MRFKDFILNEDIGLGNMGARMDSLFNSPQFTAQAGAYMNSDVSGSDQPDPTAMGNDPVFVPSNDLTIPQVTRSGRIKVLNQTRNPIYVELTDGTKAHFSYDEWKRIQGEPKIGSMMTIVYQRHPEDRTKTHSKIDKVFVN